MSNAFNMYTLYLFLTLYNNLYNSQTVQFAKLHHHRYNSHKYKQINEPPVELYNFTELLEVINVLDIR